MLALGAAASASQILPGWAAVEKHPVVIELFTSQGCSSCPPADAFLEEARSMKGVLSISLHVDYWDYLGWRDTLGDKAYSRRQYDYARARNDGEIYTPQMIVNGEQHFVGSNRVAVNDAISWARARTPSPWVPI